VIVLGINAYHADAAAALVVDGRVVAAAEEERFRRIKHWSGFPAQAIRWCLADAGVSLADVGHVAINSDPRAAWAPRLRQVLRRPPSLARIMDGLRQRKQRLGVLEELADAFDGQRCVAQLHRVPHHLAHLASAYFATPWDAALAVSIDGSGDFATGAWGPGRGSHLALAQQVWFPHSLGIYYQAMTQYLGFGHYGDEYKVMGLAPCGEPRFMAEIGRVLAASNDGSYRLDARYFRHETAQLGTVDADGSPRFGSLYSEQLVALLGPARRPDEPLTQRHKDLAHSVQVGYENALFALLNALHLQFPGERLALAGGCAQNSVANGKIALHTPFAEVYVAAAGYDAGGALGAALATWHRLGGRRCDPLPHAQLGPAFDDAQIELLLNDQRSRIETAGCRIAHFADPDLLDQQVVDTLIVGGVVGWFQGRMEWGPRALGQRSILADPRRADMQDILNRKIKRRESFRPFAPSILREHVADWFARDVDVPFMGQVLPIRAERRARIPAVTHVDGSGRLQTVTRVHNARFHALIEAFHARTGVPMLLNTSFNENEPIVCAPLEALDCFLRTRMDRLVMGNFLVSRADASGDAA
jgi:carbamoyltransferase